MQKLQVKTPDGWRYVLACRLDNGKLLTTPDRRRALPPEPRFAEQDLAFFKGQYQDKEFRLSAE